MSGGRVKQGSCLNRGYVGYHTTWDGIRVFLRSKAEFVYAKVLDHQKIPYKLECVTYTINGKRYKPDFFIFDANYQSIVKIVEIKGLNEKATALNYLSRFKQYFASIGIEYDVIWKYRALISEYGLQKDIEQWIETSLKNYDFISDVRGQNNPMFNQRHSIQTKKLIGEKCKQRNLDPEYRKRNSEAQTSFFNSPEGALRRQKISELRKISSFLKNPIVTKQCTNCGQHFKQKLNQKGFCNGKCLREWNYNNVQYYGKHKSSSSYTKQLHTLLDRISKHYHTDIQHLVDNLDFYVKQSKKDNIIPIRKGITIKTLKKHKVL